MTSICEGRVRSPGGFDRGGFVEGTDVLLLFIYLLYVGSQLFRDELWLRVTLCTVSVGFVVWGAWLGQPVTIVANGLFAVISIRHIVRIVMSRRAVELSPEQRAVHGRLFSSMSDREFFLFWHLGSERVVEVGPVVERGERFDSVMLLLDGTYAVHNRERTIELDAPGLVGEMSFVIGEDATANATVTVPADCRIREWPKELLRDLHRSHPDLAVPFLRSLGADIATKVSR